MEATKAELKKLVAEGKVGEAIEKLLGIPMVLNSSDLADVVDEVVILSFNWNKVKTERDQGIISYDQYNVQVNQITRGLLKQINHLPHQLPTALEQFDTDGSIVELMLDRPIEEFTTSKRNGLKSQLAQFLGIDKEALIIIKIINGSTIVRLSLPSVKAYLLVDRFNQGKTQYSTFFRSLKISNARIIIRSFSDFAINSKLKLAALFNIKSFRQLFILVFALTAIIGIGYYNYTNSIPYLVESLDVHKEKFNQAGELFDQKITENRASAIELKELLLAAKQAMEGDSLSIIDIEETLDPVRKKIGQINADFVSIDRLVEDLEYHLGDFLSTGTRILNKVPRNESNEQQYQNLRSKVEQARLMFQDLNSKYDSMKSTMMVFSGIFELIDRNLRNREVKLDNGEIEDLIIANNTLTTNLEYFDQQSTTIP